MNRRFKKSSIIVTIFAIALGIILSVPLLTSQYARADAASDSFKKALLSGLKTCYNDTYMKSTIQGVDYYGTSSLMTSKAFGTDGSSKGTVKVPNKVGNNIASASISCKQLFENLNSQFGKNPTLTDLGYHLNNSSGNTGSSKNCVWYEYTYNDNGISTTGRTERVCFQVTDGEAETMNDYTVEVESSATTGYGGKNGPMSLYWLNGSYTFRLNTSNTTYQDIVVGGNPSWNELLKKLNDYKETINTFQDCEDVYCNQYYRPYSGTSVQSSIGGGEVYENYTRSATGALEALHFYTGSQSTTWTSNSVAFNSIDVYTMYSSYFNQAVQAHPNVLSRVPDDQCTTENTYEYALYNNGKWCKVNGVESVNESYNGVNISGDYWTGPLKSMPFSEIVKTLGKLNYQYIENQGGVVGGLDGVTIDNGNNNDGNTSTPGSSGETESATIDKCYTAAQSLGWVVCPVLDVVGSTVSKVYEFMADSFLEVDASLFSTGGGNKSTYDGWKIFRGIANTCFAIAFVIVILAQITGIGISNYNIKKVLPRLIVVVILVNISFIVCQLAVDLSNIAGSGLQAFFEDLANKVEPNTAQYTLNGIINGVLMTLFTGATVGVAATIAVLSWELWLLPFLLALFGCLIGVLFFFIILGARQAGIILLVVLAPVAIVCYALPNTKSIYDKWQKMFTALLLVYPICGLLMGAGKFASALLVSAGGDQGFFYMLIAMLLTVLPFFMIPGILKSSMAMMGNLGMKISNFGKGVSGGATRAVRNSEPFRNVQRDLQRDYDKATAERLENRIAKREKKGKRISSGLSNRAYRHRSAYQRTVAEDERARAMAGFGSPDASIMRYSAEREALDNATSQQRDAYNSGMMTDADNNRINANDMSQIGTEYFRQLERLHANRKDKQALSRVRALQDIMMKSDDGRTMLSSQMLRYAAQHQSEYAGDRAPQDNVLKQASDHILQSDAYAGEMKKANRGTLAMLSDFNGGQFDKLYSNGGVTAYDGSGAVTEDLSKGASFSSSFYERQGLNSYDENTITSADDSVLAGVNRALEDTENPLTPQQRGAVAQLAGNAYGKENLNVKPKIRDQLRSAIVNSNDAQTITGTSARALNRFAEDLKQKGVVSAEQRNGIVNLARQAFAGHYVTDAEHAAALNNILAAAGEQQVEWSGARVDTQPDSTGSGRTDSGSVRIRNAGRSGISSAPSSGSAPSSDTLHTNPDGTVSGRVGPITVSGAQVRGPLIIDDSSSRFPTRRERAERDGTPKPDSNSTS